MKAIDNLKAMQAALLDGKSVSPDTSDGYSVIGAAIDEIERLRSVLRKISVGYPCQTAPDMKRIATEALGAYQQSGGKG